MEGYTPPPPHPSTDNVPHLEVQVGEFLVKTGNMMFSGYYGDPEKTREAFTDDGFYRQQILKSPQYSDSL